MHSNWWYVSILFFDKFQRLSTSLILGWDQANENIGILGQVKDSRKEMYMLEWTNRQQELMMDDLKNKIKELQLLRVTKELQKNLRYVARKRV